MMVRSAIAGLGAIMLAVGAPAMPPSSPAQAIATDAPASAITADGWTIYGGERRLMIDPRVPGQGAVRVAARPERGEPWASGAVAALPSTYRPGARVEAVFWARAEQPVTVPVTLQANAAPYARFAERAIALTRQWQRVTIAGNMPTDPAAGAQIVSVQLGQAGTAVLLGPVLFFRDRPAAKSIDRAVAAFHPDRVAQDVRIRSDAGVVLAGTLRLPLGRGRGPFPTVVVIAGSGANGRGGFDLLMSRLLADGIATLEYDKRGVGQSTGTLIDTVPLMARDTAAAVAFLRQRRDVDAKRVALVGHSQGGAVASAVAAADPHLRGIVMLAGPTVPGDEMVLAQYGEQVRAAGVDATAVARQQAAIRRLIEAHAAHADAATMASLRQRLSDDLVATKLAPPDSAETAVATLDSDVALAVWNYRFDRVLGSVRVPVLAMFGTLDVLVPAALHAPAARAALAGNPAAEVVVYPGLNHAFQHATTSSLANIAALGPPNSAPEMIGRVGDWLDRQFGLAPDTDRRPRFVPLSPGRGRP
ncbi:alpha/beta hydrolase [Sphingomonas crusticola]|uniref:alpha/beta hydrolase n=1 Tax=Sphingomonas crusticola TaxID=1697973 RepID=UPI0013C2C2CF|nr:alpha/beta hydrolase [Sphingomonas crusticola]